MKTDYPMPPMPARIARLPQHNGVPVPFYVDEVNGVPDFNTVRPRALADCHFENLCWICGTKMGAFKAFVVGAINGINRLSEEPPCHADCAEYAARAALAGSDEVTLVWVTRNYKLTALDGSMNFKMGAPEERHFFFQGRPAEPSEIAASIRRGIPLLRAQAQHQGPEAVAAIEKLERTLDDAESPR